MFTGNDLIAPSGNNSKVHKLGLIKGDISIFLFCEITNFCLLVIIKHFVIPYFSRVCVISSQLQVDPLLASYFFLKRLSISYIYKKCVLIKFTLILSLQFFPQFALPLFPPNFMYLKKKKSP